VQGEEMKGGIFGAHPHQLGQEPFLAFLADFLQNFGAITKLTLIVIMCVLCSKSEHVKLLFY
jgi:hypothetical protein